VSLTGLDTNVLLRLVLNDDPHQRSAALRLGASFDDQTSGFVSLVVLVEFYWALRSRYSQPKAMALKAVGALLKTRGLVFEAAEAVTRALDRAAQSRADFADAVIAEHNLASGCAKTVTFDKIAARTIPGMDLLV
jgi:predicted nucleic-acid-binding protein